jgi:chemotaxis signal transduction protein
MSGTLGSHAAGVDRLLTFEVAAVVYGLPISVVLEVTEADRATCVPGLPTELVAVMNWHGDALPLVNSEQLLAGVNEESPDEDSEVVDSVSASADIADVEEGAILKEQILVVSDGGDESAALGMPVDRVIGLVNGTSRSSRSTNVVAERRSVDGRVVHVLDPRRLVARAEELIERVVGATAAVI